MLFALLTMAVAAPAAPAPRPIASASVLRQGDQWSADYRLHVRAPVWLFSKSILPRESKTSWRSGSVRVLTPGVRLQRLGHYDALIADKGYMPARVRLRFTPYFKDIEAGYDPAIELGGDAIAIYADAFKVVPMPSRAAAMAAPKDEDSLPASAQPTRLTFRDGAGPILFRGQRVPAAVSDNGETYVVFGKIDPVIGPALTTIIDPRMPEWITAYLKREIPAILADYQRRMGPAPVGQPMLIASWQGPTPKMLSLGGSVLPGLVTMVFEGEGAVSPNPRTSNHARWFVAHEAAHFWLGQAVGYSSPAESWITEGGADLLAIRATAAADPTFDVRARLLEARAECAPFLRRGGVASAYLREGDFRAYYACGTLIALAAEQASGGDFASFVKELIDRHGGNRIVTRADWLALLNERSRSPATNDAIAALLDRAHADPEAAIDGLLEAARLTGQFERQAS